MTATLLTRLSTARSLLAQLRLQRSTGNPNHDEHGRFARGPGSPGHAKRVKRRKRKLEQLRKAGHKEIREYRVIHRNDRKELVHDQAKAWKAMRREHVKERNSLRREHKREKTVKADRKQEHQDLRDAQRSERRSLHEDHVTDRAGMRESQHDDRREVIERLKEELHEEVPGRSKTGRKGPERSANATLDLVRPIPPGQPRAGPATDPPGRLSRRATHKAGTAEAILSHCLRRRGWTARFTEGRLTGRQHLTLLEDIRQYGRAWLRHEAEAFFRAYGAADDIGRTGGDLAQGPADRPGGNAVLEGASRGLKGRIGSALSRFFDRARSFIRELIGAGAQSLKGPEPLTDAETAVLDEAARIQAEYLRKFQLEVETHPPAILVDQKPATAPWAGTDTLGQDTTILVQPAPMTAGQFVARAESYATSAHQAAQKMVRQTVAKQQPVAAPGAAPVLTPTASPWTGGKLIPGVAMERRIYDPEADNCTDCPPLAHRGWQLPGVLPDIGDTECNGYCHCHFEYSDGSAPPTVNGKAAAPVVKPPRKIKLKPVPAPGTPEAVAAKEALQADIIHKEVQKFLAGKPTQLSVGTMSPRIIAPIPATPAPPLYHHAEAEYDAAGNLIFKDFE
jgi:hypothetical protein